MGKILVTGSTGQIGSDLVPTLRDLYGKENVIAAGHSRTPSDEFKDSGPYINLDVTNFEEIKKTITEFEITKIFHLASILSKLGEQKPNLAYQVNIQGLYNILEAAREKKLEKVIVPSSIAAFGEETPRDNTPNDTIQNPSTIYGISKKYGELMGNYYFNRFGLDVRGVRFPGIISWKTEPTAGTTDYAVAIFYEAIRQKKYTCYLKADTALPMMYMPDAVISLIEIEKAEIKDSKHRADFNINSMSFTPSQLAETIKKRIPEFSIDYEIDPVRQSIAKSWPKSLDDAHARNIWGWLPKWDIEKMTDDMLKNLREKLKDEY